MVVWYSGWCGVVDIDVDKWMVVWDSGRCGVVVGQELLMVVLCSGRWYEVVDGCMD